MRGPPPSPVGLPRGLRFAAILSLLFAAPMGFLSLSEALTLGQLAEHREALTSSPLSIVGDPTLDARIAQAQYNALAPLRESRSLILGALSVASAFLFVSAGRILRPDGLPLERIRRLLAGSALAAAVLRTLDGAQGAVVAKRMAPVVFEAMKVLSPLPAAEARQLESLMGWLMPATSMVFTAFVAGTLVVLGQYFQSDAVRQAISAQDAVLTGEED